MQPKLAALCGSLLIRADGKESKLMVKRKQTVILRLNFVRDE